MLPTSRFALLAPFATPVTGGVTAPRRSRAAAVGSGVKRRDKLDLALLFSSHSTVSAATFTRNAAAVPVRLPCETSDCGRLRGVVINAGNANACTGRHGLADAARMRLLAAHGLRLPVEQVAVCSTGLIRAPLPMDSIEAGIVAAARAVPSGGGVAAVDRFAVAILTTDRHARAGALEVVVPVGEVKLGFAAKGCGMISHDMATMLWFVTRDAVMGVERWARLPHDAVERSFNRITGDGQESTNDTVVGLCNGASGVEPGEEGVKRLGETLDAALAALALCIAADGEGSTRVMKPAVTGAGDVARAGVRVRPGLPGRAPGRGPHQWRHGTQGGRRAQGAPGRRGDHLHHRRECRTRRTARDHDRRSLRDQGRRMSPSVVV